MLKIENMTCCESISELYVQGIKDINSHKYGGCYA